MKYRTIVADPPWPQKGSGSLRGRHGWRDANGSSRPMAYQTMTVDEIADLPVSDLAAPDAHLYLWTTNGFLPAAFDVMRAWGFRYSTTLVWAKAPMGGGLGGCYGIATEYVIFGRRGQLPALGKIPRTWFDWKRPYLEGRHSAKPPEMYEMVEAVSPAPRLELFARRSRPGWHSWGDEAPDPILWPEAMAR